MSQAVKLPFPTFPEFTELKLEHRDAYNEFVSQFPPCGSLSFGSLMTWWSVIGPCKIARHGDNLVISLWYPGYDEYSGLSVLGHDGIDETICTIFDFQRERGEALRLTHVPEFVATKIRFPEMFKFNSERDHDECIVNIDALSNTDNLPEHKKWKVNRFLAEFDEKRMNIKPLDISSVYVQDTLLEKLDDWRDKGSLNNFAKHDEDCLRLVIKEGSKMGYSSLGFYLDHELEGYIMLYDADVDNYGMISHARFSFKYPHFLEIVIYMYAKWFKMNGITEVNIEADSGFPELRQLKLSMGPSNFLRMYSILKHNKY